MAIFEIIIAKFAIKFCDNFGKLSFETGSKLKVTKSH